MRKAIIFLFLSIAIIVNSFAQYSSYRKFKYEWHHDFPSKNTISPEFTLHDVVIFNETNSYSISGNKAEFLKIYIKKYIHYKYSKPQGVSDYSTFTIPESFDLSFDHKDIPAVQENPLHRPKYFDIKVTYFACRIKKKDGKVIPAELEDEMLTDRKMFAQRYSSAYSYQFKIKNIEEGDEVELEYAYEMPYDQNWYLFNSVRMFFHGTYPKQQYELTFNFKRKLGTTLMYNNGCKPASKTEVDGKVTYVFKQSNLPGCISEPNSRPHEELPYFVFDMTPEDLRYHYKMPGSLESAPLPYWLYILKMREYYTLWQIRRADPLIHDKQWLKTQAFISTNTTDVDADKPFLKLIKLHNLIVEDFDYQQDGDYFAGKDTKLERLGDFTEQQKLREISRFKLYARIFNTLKIPYHTVYFMDKRVARMGQSYISPVIDNEYVFSLPVNNGLFYMYPKKNRYGYYGDELPFYWEGSPALFVQFGNLWADTITDLTFIKTPSSSEDNNIRNSNVKVNVNLHTGKLSFEARTSLSGQFSTMTRSVYDYGLIDSTLSEVYGKKIDDIGNGVVSDGSKRTAKSTTFPYKVSYLTNYRCDLVSSISDSVFQIDMTNWFHHIVTKGLKNEGRQLAYYPDFRFQDVYKYYMIFEEDVSLVNDSLNEFSIVNNLGSYKVNFSQLNSKTILLESNFIVSSTKVDANQIADVILINEAINRTNTSKLGLKIVRTTDGQ